MGVVRTFFQGNPAIFIEAGVHAREWIGPAVATYLLNLLLTSKDADVQKIARNFDWIFVPVLNVDGYVYTHKSVRLKHYQENKWIIELLKSVRIDCGGKTDVQMAGAKEPISIAISILISEVELHVVNFKMEQPFDKLSLFLIWTHTNSGWHVKWSMFRHLSGPVCTFGSGNHSSNSTRPFHSESKSFYLIARIWPICSLSLWLHKA